MSRAGLLESAVVLTEIDQSSTRFSCPDIDRAILDYSQALKIKRDGITAYINRGVLLCERGDIPSAIDDYDHALALNPKSPVLFFNRGVAYQQLGNYSQALKDYSTSISLCKDGGMLWALRNR